MQTAYQVHPAQPTASDARSTLTFPCPAGYVLHKTLELLGLPADHIYVHVLSKGTNVHSEAETNAMEKMVQENNIERVVVLDQGSRPGKIVGNLTDGGSALLLIDHHQSEDVCQLQALESDISS